MDHQHEEMLQSHDNATILELPESETVGIEVICRLCANPNERVIGIYSEEGIANDLANKMNLYLPVKVSENDTLPLQCCWSCASTVLAWHELVIASVEADRRLRGLEIVPHKLDHSQVTYTTLTTDESIGGTAENENRLEPDPSAASLTVFCQEVVADGTPDSSEAHEKKLLSPLQLHLSVFKPHVGTGQGAWIKPDIEPLYIQNIDSTTSLLVKCEVSDLNQLKQGVDLLQPKMDGASVNNKLAKRKRQSKPRKAAGSRKQAPNAVKSVTKTKVNTGNIFDFDDPDSNHSDDPKALSDWMIKKNDEILDSTYHFACQYCPSIYVYEEGILNHMKLDHPDKVAILDTIPPPNASLSKTERRKSTKFDQDAIEEAKVIVEGRIYYNCKICDKSLHSPYTFIWHMRIHTGERPYICDLCGKQFRVSQGLVRHLRETHEGIKNYGCDICGRMFATRRNVEEHRRIHTNERPYICDLCGKTFKQKASLFVHGRSHTDSFPFKCNYCNQGFRTRPPLLIHVTRHTGEKPYPCDVCGRCFRIKYELKRHRLIHSDEKPFLCVPCGLGFRQKRYLNNHNKLNHELPTL